MGNENISDYGIKNLTNLKTLYNYGESKITSDGLKHLTNLVNLQL